MRRVLITPTAMAADALIAQRAAMATTAQLTAINESEVFLLSLQNGQRLP